MVTIAADSEGRADQRMKDAFFIVEPSQRQLLDLAKLLDAGTLKAFVSAVVPLEEASVAHSRAVRTGRGFGKVVIAVSHNGREVGDEGDVFSRRSGYFSPGVPGDLGNSNRANQRRPAEEFTWLTEG